MAKPFENDFAGREVMAPFARGVNAGNLFTANLSVSLRSKLRGVRGDPVQVGPRLRSCYFLDRGGDERRLPDRGSPSVEQRVHDGRGHGGKALTPRFLRRDLLDAYRAANYAANRGYLLVLTQRLRPGQDIFHAGMFILR